PPIHRSFLVCPFCLLLFCAGWGGRGQVRRLWFPAIHAPKRTREAQPALLRSVVSSGAPRRAAGPVSRVPLGRQARREPLNPSGTEETHEPARSRPPWPPPVPATRRNA